MARGLHWAVFVIIGIIISSVSYYLNMKRGGRFILFVYLGIVFFAYGLAKLGFSKVGTKTRIEVKHADKRDLSQQQLVRKQHMQPQQQSAQPGFAARCPNCGLSIYRYDNFCSRCGMRLK